MAVSSSCTLRGRYFTDIFLSLLISAFLSSAFRTIASSSNGLPLESVLPAARDDKVRSNVGERHQAGFSIDVVGYFNDLHIVFRGKGCKKK